MDPKKPPSMPSLGGQYVRLTDFEITVIKHALSALASISPTTRSVRDRLRAL